MTDTRNTADALFVRFREGGDADALGELFDLVAPELRPLAMRWSRDPDAVEDLIQSTFLTAIRRAERFDATRSVVPWLVGLLGVHAARLRRSHARRPDPGRLEEREEADPAELVVDEELRAEVELAVEQLPDRYRGVVRGALIDGRPPRALAEELGREPGTVRVQLHRGIALLRRALPPSLASGLALTVHGRRAAAEAATRHTVVAAAQGAVGQTSSALILGGVLLNKLIVAGGSAALLALVWWWQASDGAGLERPGTVGEAPTVAVASPDRLAPADANQRPTNPRPATPWTGPGAEGLQVGREKLASANVADPEPWILRGQVVGLVDQAVDESTVLLSLDREEGPLELARARLVRGEGEVGFAFELGELGAEAEAHGELTVTLLHPLHHADRVRFELPPRAERAGAETEVVVEAVAVGAVAMRIVDEFGDALPHHHAVLLPFPEGAERPLSEPVAYGRSDENGQLVMTVPSVGRFAVLSAAWKRRPATRVADCWIGERVDLGDVALERGETLEGVARRGDGYEPAGTLVISKLVGAEDSYRMNVGNQRLQLDWIQGRFEHTHCANLIEGDDGAFELLGLMPGRYSVEVFVPGGPSGTSFEVFASARGLELQDSKGRVRLAVPRGHRQVLEGQVRVTPEAGEPFDVHWAPGHGIHCVVAMEPGERADVHVALEDGREFELEAVAPAAGEEVELRLPVTGGPTGSVAIVDGPGGPELEGLEFQVLMGTEDGYVRRDHTAFTRDARGRVALTYEDLPTGEYSLRLSPMNAVRPASFFPPMRFEVLPDEECEVLVSTDPAAVVPIVVAGADGRPINATVSDETGEPVEVDTVMSAARRFRSRRGTISAAHSSELVLRPGVHRLRVESAGHVGQEISVDAPFGVASQGLAVRMARAPEAAASIGES